MAETPDIPARDPKAEQLYFQESKAGLVTDRAMNGGLAVDNSKRSVSMISAKSTISTEAKQV